MSDFGWKSANDWNIKYIKYTLRAWNALPQAAMEADTLNQFKASLPGATN